MCLGSSDLRVRIRIGRTRGVTENERDSLSLDKLDESLDRKALVSLGREIECGQTNNGDIDIIVGPLRNIAQVQCQIRGLEEGLLLFGITRDVGDTVVVDDTGNVGIASVVERRGTFDVDGERTADALDAADKPREERLLCG